MDPVINNLAAHEVRNLIEAYEQAIELHQAQAFGPLLELHQRKLKELRNGLAGYP